MLQRSKSDELLEPSRGESTRTLPGASVHRFILRNP